MITLGEGETIPMHAHVSREEQYECRLGKGIVIVDGIEKSFKPGERVLVNKGTEHSVRNTGKGDHKFFAVNIPKAEPGDTVFV